MSLTLLLAIATAASSVPTSLIRIEAVPSTASVHYRQWFEVTVSIRNASSEAQVLQLDGCQLAWQWKADNPDVRILRPAECRKNPLQYVRVASGETHQVRISASISASDTSQASATVTFRLGCQPHLGYDIATLAPYIWSNAISVTGVK